MRSITTETREGLRGRACCPATRITGGITRVGLCPIGRSQGRRLTSKGRGTCRGNNHALLLFCVAQVCGRTD